MAAGIRVSVGSHCLHMRLTLRGEYSHVVDLCMCLLVRSILCWDDWLLRKSCFWPCLFLEMSKKNDKKNRKLGWVWLQCYFGSSVWKGHFWGKAVLLFPVSLYHICPVDEKLMLKKYVIWKEDFFFCLIRKQIIAEKCCGDDCSFIELLEDLLSNKEVKGGCTKVKQ